MPVTRGVVFDCDGVLFESRAANLAYYNTVLEYFGVAPVRADEEDRQRAYLCHTAASPVVFAELLGQERVAAALDFAVTLGFRQFMPFMQLEPGIEGALTTLTKRFRLAVATNRGASMHEILEHFALRHYFSAVVTSRDVARPKPCPDMLQLVSRQLEIDPDELVFIGDSHLDQLAAQRAKIRFVGYQTSFPGECCVTHHKELESLIGCWL
ncbi:MAG: HAD family hydrolase [Desulfuromonadales bacterium]|nr:HAD family hydrolase [Desulfuromonadales bacterium]